jgi:hypothetical protein
VSAEDTASSERGAQLIAEYEHVTLVDLLTRIEKLRAALPRCGSYLDDSAYEIGTCMALSTKRAHPDAIDYTETWCAAHARPTAIDLPWAAAIRELGW